LEAEKLDVKSVPKAFVRKSFFATVSVSVLVMVAAMLLGARVAVADSVWVQSYQRASASEACVAQPGETPWQESWGTNPGWAPSWEQWANAGRGGWVCSRNIMWAKTPISAGNGDSQALPCGGSLTYAVGDIGPGCGRIFLISGGKTYEMAPETWSDSSGDDTPILNWCIDLVDVPLASGTAIGTGKANTAAMAASVACSSGAAAAVLAYAGGGLTDWFLPSKGELNQMYLYSRVVGFDAATYGFASDYYWSSSQDSNWIAEKQGFGDGDQSTDYKDESLRVRPIRAF
jgi:hypothetical protein